MAKRWDDPKDPHEILDYEVDWTTVLAGDEITTSTWTLPEGITGDQESFTATHTKIWLSGGSEYVNYDLLNRITTAAGRTRDQTCVLKCRTK